MLQRVARGGTAITTTRAPVRVDGARVGTSAAAPRIGEHTDAIVSEFSLDA
jgi:crotonobetainyl-CoA:carnitine CoA-transferase CaiB-like acyl-CoA transferase